MLAVFLRLEEAVGVHVEVEAVIQERLLCCHAVIVVAVALRLQSCASCPATEVKAQLPVLRQSLLHATVH